MAAEDKAMEELLQKSLNMGIYSGYALMVGDGKEVLYEKAAGSTGEGRGEDMGREALFDLASLTKPLATGAVALKMVEKGILSLDESINSYVDKRYRDRWGRITCRHLLTHTSGLPAWYPTYTWGQGREAAFHGILQLEPLYTPGTKQEYSCLGFILLGLILEKVGQASLDRLARELIFEPLGMEKTGYLPLKRGFAETDLVLGEGDHLREKDMVEKAGLSFHGWREGFAPGEPNDGNSAYTMEGVSGNAGLFGTAGDVCRFGQAWLQSLTGRGFWSSSLARLATASQRRDLENFGLAWVLYSSQLKEVPIPSSMLPFLPSPMYPTLGPGAGGELLSSRAFGHTGFTGTSLWIDPVLELVVVFMANHLHPVFTPGLQQIRARVHNRIVATLT